MSVFDTLSFRETLLGEEVSDNEAEKKIKSIDFSMTIFFFFLKHDYAIAQMFLLHLRS